MHAFWRSRKDCCTWALVSGFLGTSPLARTVDDRSVVVIFVPHTAPGWSGVVAGNLSAARRHNQVSKHMVDARILGGIASHYLMLRNADVSRTNRRPPTE